MPFAFGCKADGSADGGNVVRQNVEEQRPDEENPECPDCGNDGRSLPPPEVLPHMPDKRGNDKPFRPEPKPLPAPHRRK